MAEAESTESKSIKELTKAVKESNAERRTQLEALAATTDQEGSTRAADAREQLKKEDESLAVQKRLLGVSDKRLQKAAVLSEAIEEQKKIMEAQKTELEKIGVDATKTKSYREEEVKLAKLEKQHAASTTRETARDTWNKTKKTFAPMTSAIKKMSDKFSGGILGFKSKLTLGGLALGAFALAVLAFIDTPWFDKIYNVLVNVIPKALSWIYNKVLVPLGKFLWKYLGPLFTDIKEKIDGEGPGSEKSWWKILKDNWIAILGIATALGAVGAIISLVGSAIGLVIGAWVIISTVVGFLFSPIGLIILAIAAVATALWLIYDNWDNIAEALDKMTFMDFVKVFGKAFNEVIAWFLGAFLNLGHWATEGIYRAIGGVLNLAGATTTGKFFTDLADKQAEQKTKGAETVLKWINSGVKGAEFLAGTMAFGESTKRLKENPVMKSYRALRDAGDAYGKFGRDVDQFVIKKFNDLTDKAGDLVETGKKIAKAAPSFKPDISQPAIGALVAQRHGKKLRDKFAKGGAHSWLKEEPTTAQIIKTQNLLGQETSKALLANIKNNEGSLAAIQQQTTVLSEVKDAIGTFTAALLSGNFGQMFQSNKTTNISSTNTPMVSQSYYLGPAWYNKVGNSQ